MVRLGFLGSIMDPYVGADFHVIVEDLGVFDAHIDATVGHTFSPVVVPIASVEGDIAVEVDAPGDVFSSVSAAVGVRAGHSLHFYLGADIEVSGVGGGGFFAGRDEELCHELLEVPEVDFLLAEVDLDPVVWVSVGGSRSGDEGDDGDGR